MAPGQDLGQEPPTGPFARPRSLVATALANAPLGAKDVHGVLFTFVVAVDAFLKAVTVSLGTLRTALVTLVRRVPHNTTVEQRRVGRVQLGVERLKHAPRGAVRGVHRNVTGLHKDGA